MLTINTVRPWPFTKKKCKLAAKRDKELVLAKYETLLADAKKQKSTLESKIKSITNQIEEVTKQEDMMYSILEKNPYCNVNNLKNIQFDQIIDIINQGKADSFKDALVVLQNEEFARQQLILNERKIEQEKEYQNNMVAETKAKNKILTEQAKDIARQNQIIEQQGNAQLKEAKKANYRAQQAVFEMKDTIRNK